jgi:hypothetical protein
MQPQLLFADEPLLLTLQRHLADLPVRLFSLGRDSEPARMPEPVRPGSPPSRPQTPSRQPPPSRGG